MIRDLPRGPYGAFLHAHYFRDRSNVLPRFSMGQGVIFSIQRVKSQEASLVPPSLLAETDPLMLEEMAALIAAIHLDVVSLAEMRRRLVQHDYKRRFVCFTFDGAYRSILNSVAPLFRARNMPFAVHVSARHLRSPELPWWLALESLVGGSNRIITDIDGERIDVRCRTAQEKRQAYALLFRLLMLVAAEERDRLIDRAFMTCKITKADAHAQHMLTPDEIRQLAQSSLVTIGLRTDDDTPLGETSFDEAQAGLTDSLQKVTEATGVKPQHFAYSVAEPEAVPTRITEMIREIGFDTASGNVEGALWPEHENEMLTLPRIALDNDPTTLVRALLLGADATPISASDTETAPRRAS
ncbi:MAG: polysaccharide deacetylase family protein [Hyphomicrobiales bacterium]|nr:polysaccharide deacetylase family protein [Hyphomicrobiales bacterium]